MGTNRESNLKILITGGAGFKGAVLSKILTDEHHAVTVVDHLKWGAWPLMSLIPKSNFKFVRGDVRDRELMRKLLEPADVVINLAAIVGYPACEAAADEAFQTNLHFVEWLTEMMRSCQYLFQASTGSVYGKLEETCTEDSPCNPLSIYGETKLKAEKCVEQFGGVNFRFATAFGVSPCMRFDVVPAFFMYRALTERYAVVYEGQARRTFIDVWDMGSSYSWGIENYGDLQGQVFNVGDDTLNVTKMHVVEMIRDIIQTEEGWELPILNESLTQDKDARDYEVDYSKIQNLGFKCEVDLMGGLSQTYRAAKAMIGSSPNPWRIS